MVALNQLPPHRGATHARALAEAITQAVTRHGLTVDLDEVQALTDRGWAIVATLADVPTPDPVTRRMAIASLRVDADPFAGFPQGDDVAWSDRQARHEGVASLAGEQDR